MRIRPANCRGFTLIELIISGGLMSLVLVSAYLCLSAGTSSQRLVEARADAAQIGRVILGMIVADLRSAVPMLGDSEFIGMRRTLGEVDADNVDFATRNYIAKRPGESDWSEVSYFVVKNPRTERLSLFRRRDPSPDPEPLAGGNQEELATDVLGLRLEYYDGWDWYDEWGDPTGKQQFSTLPDPNISGLPEAVRITLTLRSEAPRADASEDEEEEEDEGTTLVLQTTARLNMATFFYENSSQGSESGSSTSDSAGGQPSSSARQPGGAQ